MKSPIGTVGVVTNNGGSRNSGLNSLLFFRASPTSKSNGQKGKQMSETRTGTEQRVDSKTSRGGHVVRVALLPIDFYAHMRSAVNPYTPSPNSIPTPIPINVRPTVDWEKPYVSSKTKVKVVKSRYMIP